MPHGQTICTFKLLKPCRSISGEFSLTQCCWILLQHDNAQAQTSLTTEEAQTQMNWSSTPTTQPRSCSLRFGALKDANHEKMFETDDEVGEEVAASTQYIWRKKRIDARYLLAQGCWMWWRLCVQFIHLCNYPLSMFKELYYKLLAIKKLCCKTSWASFVQYVYMHQ